MRIIWITNIMMPPLCERLGLPVPVIGGWMYSSAKRILGIEPTMSLAIATVYKGNQLQKHIVDGITYYLLPLHGKDMRRYHSHLEALWKSIAADFQPDLVHLHGTEFPVGQAFIKACPEVKAVVSIQGIASVIDRYYLGGMRFGDILRNITFRDVVRWNNLWQGKHDFTVRGRYERETISMVGHVIGRTAWDKAHTYAINPSAKYHFCNETLRDEFYMHQWRYEDCEKHSIFLSQAHYPIKGLHKVLEALPFVLREYPDTMVYVAGEDIRKLGSFKNRIRRSGYGSYIMHLIRKLKLEEHIVFTGSLDENAMCKRYLLSNLFICPSAIENSPNSLGEAQLLGVPCLASYVGGVPDMIPTEDCGIMYRFEEVEMMAYRICEWFEKSKSFDNSEMRRISRERHEPLENSIRLVEIYKGIIKSID